jgi:hypothetical protein
MNRLVRRVLWNAIKDLGGIALALFLASQHPTASQMMMLAILWLGAYTLVQLGKCVVAYRVAYRNELVALRGHD